MDQFKFFLFIYIGMFFTYLLTPQKTVIKKYDFLK